MKRLLIPVVIGLIIVGIAITAVSAMNRPPTPVNGTIDTATASQLLVYTYRPDGSTITLPIKLIKAKSNEQYILQSGAMFTVPEGTYDLQIDMLEPYRLSGLQLTAGTPTQLSITLSEIRFAQLDKTGATLTYQGLNVQAGDQTQHVIPGTPVLLSPGSWAIQAAPDDRPDANQPASISVSPGQRLDVSLRNDLFGGGTVEVDVLDIDGKPMQVPVNVYQAGKEDGPPVTVFQSGSPSDPLPQGDYVVHVLTQIAVRLEEKIGGGQNPKVTVQRGKLLIVYKDTNGLSSSPMVYIVSSTEMQRLNLPVEQMPGKSPYGILIKSGQPLLLPEGQYSVMVQDLKDTRQDNIQVTAGKTTTVELRSK